MSSNASSTRLGGSPFYDVVGSVDLSARGKVELAGADRATFLHNLCTNDVKKLEAGTGFEAFLLDAKGHIQFYVLVHNTGDRLVLEELAPAGEASGARLRKHLDKYLIREKVTLADRTSEWTEILVAGTNSAEIIGRVLEIVLPTAPLANVACTTLGEGAFVVRSVQAAEPNYTIFCSREAASVVQSKLVDAGVVSCDLDAWNATRIEAGLPLYGVDIAEKNLAQEIDRIERTISFRKGCYLGQETVARLDALGHVNKTLVVLEFAPPKSGPISAEMELTLDGQAVGSVTSAATSNRGTTVALAYVKRGKNMIGTRLDSPAGVATIVAPV